MSLFDAAVARVFEYEGGLVDDTDDPGALTKFGISTRAHPDLDIEGLTKDTAKEVYRREYWESIQLDQLESGFVAAEIFEQAVNLGPAQAIIHTQKACNYLGKNLVVDGMMGVNTLGAVNSVASDNAEPLLKVLNALQFMKYLAIIKHDPKMKKYARGWLRRVQV